MNLIKKIQSALTDDLRRKPWKGNPNPLAGHCYVACEVLYYLSSKPLKAFYIKHEGSTHWFLKTLNNKVIDPTAGQFKTPVPYDKGRGIGFLTNYPSKRAKILISRLK